MLFSILICSLHSRKEFLTRIMKILTPQLEGVADLVEILIETDEREMSIGAKRNILLDKAKGKYIAFVDDDDIVSSDYISKILDALEKDPDVVGMHLLHFNDGAFAGLTYHSLKYRSWFENQDKSTGLMRYYRNPNHLNPVRRKYAIKTRFPEISMGEDKDYSGNLLQYLETEEYITEPIYYYLYRTNK
jgi:glycosyltransferase involved in cell wall biosynthesis